MRREEPTELMSSIDHLLSQNLQVSREIHQQLTSTPVSPTSSSISTPSCGSMPFRACMCQLMLTSRGQLVQCNSLLQKREQRLISKPRPMHGSSISLKAPEQIQDLEDSIPAARIGVEHGQGTHDVLRLLAYAKHGEECMTYRLLIAFDPSQICRPAMAVDGPPNQRHDGLRHGL